MALESGHRLGRYEVRSLVGAGGMGEVYLAHDTKLERKVALKLLLARYTTSEDRLRRFSQEARAASGLNHPNIVTVHDVDVHDGTHYITTEFVEGETLRGRLRRGRIPLSEALQIATQVADALAAAHREGIVHRDIKPENILLRPDGYVKVVDFGLAKLADDGADHGETLAPTRAVVETDAGVILGTVAYMSPEQARGLPVDARTDVWSLGVVLYEMIAGRRPFDGPTSSDIIALILQRDPPKLAPFTPEATGEIELVVETALAKDVDERYQTARDLLNALKRVRKHLDTDAEIGRALPPEMRAGAAASDVRMASGASGGLASSAQPARTISSAEVIAGEIKRHKTAVAAMLAVLLIGASAAGYWAYRRLGREVTAQPFEQFKISRLTTTGRVLDAAISPDGRYVVHSMDDGPGQSLWVRQVNTSSNVEIVPSSNVLYLGMTFSRDGDYVYYVSREMGQPIGVLYQVPVLGGAPRRLIDDVDTSVTVSPDGARVAFIRNYPDDRTSSVVVANADGTGERRLSTSAPPSFFPIPADERIGPAWSPDGKTIACVVDITDAKGRHSEIAVVNAGDGTLRELTTRRWYSVRRVGWLADGSGVLAAVADTSSAYLAHQVWLVPYPGGEPRRITTDLNNYAGMSMTASGDAFVAVQTTATSNVWVAPGGDAAAASAITASRTTFDGIEGLEWTPDGRILYASMSPNGSYDLWTMKPDGSDRQPLVVNAGANLNPDVSRAGRSVVYSSDRGTNLFQIWHTGIPGGSARQLTSEEVGAFSPNVSPDGRWVLYHGAGRIWRVPIDGGERVRLTSKLTTRPVISPDGQFFVSTYRERGSAPTQLAIYPFDGGTPLKLLDLPRTASFRVRWSADGRALFYFDTLAACRTCGASAGTAARPSR